MKTNGADAARLYPKGCNPGKEIVEFVQKWNPCGARCFLHRAVDVEFVAATFTVCGKSGVASGIAAAIGSKSDM